MILVTGAAGFIGSNLVASLNESGRDDLILCDWLQQDGRWENLGKRTFLDFQLPNQLEAYLASSQAAEIKTILHMGAITDTSVRDGDLVIQRNFQFTKMLWDWSARNGATFVYASSAATYGDGRHGFDDELSLEGLKQLRPLNLYAWSKQSFDLFALGQSQTTPPRWYGLKFFNVFGPNEYHKREMRSVVSKLFSAVCEGRPARLFKSHRPDYPDGGQMRDFIYVADACRAVSHFAAGLAPSGLYNIGTGQAHSFAELMSAAYRTLGHEPSFDYIDMPDSLRSRYQYFTQATTPKLRGSGFDHPFLSLDDAVTHYVQTFLSNGDPYR